MTARRRGGFPVATTLFALFTVFTLVELFLLIWLTKATSIWVTIGLALTTGAIGSWMAKREGLAVVARFRGELASGRFPREALADGLLVLLGGALLVTPGMITDLIGFSTLAPPIRAIYRRWLVAWAMRHFRAGASNTFTFTSGNGPTHTYRGGTGPVVDAPPGSYSSQAKGRDAVDVEFRQVE